MKQLLQISPLAVCAGGASGRCAKRMRKSLVLTIMMVMSSCVATAQWRLDGDVRLGWTNIDHTVPWSGIHIGGFAYSTRSRLALT